jgi:hypothetical protein
MEQAMRRSSTCQRSEGQLFSPGKADGSSSSFFSIFADGVRCVSRRRSAFAVFQGRAGTCAVAPTEASYSRQPDTRPLVAAPSPRRRQDGEESRWLPREAPVSVR